MNEEIILNKFAERFSQLIKNSSIDIPKLAQMLGIKSKSTIYRYMNAEMAPKITTVKCASEIFNVNPVWLMGYDVPMEKNTDDILKKIGAIPLSNKNMAKIPILGTVKAGYDYLAQENWQGTIEVETSLVGDGKDFIALKVHGDSMSPVLIEDDIVIVKKQNDFETGDIVVALVNGDEATIKKGKKNENSILLQPFNPSYEPLIFTYDEMKTIPVTIVGVVRQLKREF